MQHRRDGQQGSLFWFTIPYRPDHGAAVKYTTTTLFTCSEKTLSHGSSIVGAFNEPESFKNIAPAPTVPPPLSMLHAAPMILKSFHYPQLVEEQGSSSRDVETTVHNNARMETATQAPTLDPTNLNVLLVDDAMSILKMTSMLLKRKGHKVYTAENGAEALQKLEEANAEGSLVQYDVVLMDIQMPVMDGLEATKRWREIECPTPKGKGV